MSKSTIYINGRFLTQPLSGVQRYAIETVVALDDLLGAMPKSARTEIQLLMPRGASWIYQPLTSIRLRRIGWLRGYAWEQFALPLYAKGAVVNLCNTFPLLARCPVVTVHDVSVLAAPEGYTRAFKAVYRTMLMVLRLRRNIRVITDSGFSADELYGRAGIQRERIRVVYCGADHWKRVIPEEAVLAKFDLIDSPFVLAVASENPNKNLRRLIEAFEKIGDQDLRLVLVGGRNESVFATSFSGDAARVVRTGRIDDSQLAALYRSAACFVFPSLYEGFGLPPIEAMSFGCPVVSSREASLPEVCGDAAFYCDARNSASIADAIRNVLVDKSLSARLRELGPIQAAHYTWRKAALGLLATVEAEK